MIGKRGEEEQAPLCLQKGAFASVIGFVIKAAVNVVGLDYIDKSIGIRFPYLADQQFGFFSGDHRIEYGSFLVIIAPGGRYHSGGMVCDLRNFMRI